MEQKNMHNLLYKRKYPNHHKSLESETLHIQSNVPIKEGDSVRVALHFGGVKQYTIEKILTREETNPEIFELNNNEGVYIKGVTEYYFCEIKEIENGKS